ncbi:MAG TPA: sigma-54 dependent transcriptional regulator [Xanthobacteraceae bacterium]|jgi:DNA-binding NtrC family response regulator
MTTRILVADDDPVQRRLLDAMIRRFGYEPVTVEGGEAALRLLEGKDGPGIGCVILDLVMPDLDGMGVLGRLKERGIDTPVIVQTAHGSIDAVISAMRAGAVDFVVKPAGAERLQVSLRNALAQSVLAGEVRRLRRVADNALGLEDLASQSPRMQAALKLAEKAATSDIPVLLEGESGVGKELLARAIRGGGNRADKPFVAVNCGAIPEMLVESILFGHEKGAFTGASDKQIGKFVEADGGTLFLDEIGELPMDAQVKLLRALQDGQIDAVGSRKSVKVNFRLISASNRDLGELVHSGRFREDLYYRLHIFPITVPPLRNRTEDIPDLVRRFAVRFAAEEGKRVRAVSADAIRLLTGFRWPGNVRQLENAVFRAVVLAETDEIGAAEFPQIAAQVPGFEAQVPPVALSGARPAEPILILDSPATVPGASEALAFLGPDGHVRPLEEIEAEAIRTAIARYRGRMTEVARRLKIGRSTLYRKLKDLGLETEADAAVADVAAE